MRRGEILALRWADISPDMSFLEMLDVINEGLVERGEEPIACVVGDVQLTDYRDP